MRERDSFFSLFFNSGFFFFFVVVLFFLSFFSFSHSLPSRFSFSPPSPMQGYVSDEDDAVSAPPGIIFLLLVVVGLGAATAAVVSKVG